MSAKKGGRAKGTPNRSTQELLNKAQEMGVDPFEVLLLFASGDWENLGYKEETYVASTSESGSTYKYHIDPAVRAKSAAEACQYLYPKRKAIELSNDGEDRGFKVIIEDYSNKDKS